MKKISIFLSSAMNGELDDERKSIQLVFEKEPLLNQFFDLYALEDSASTKELEKAYLDEVEMAYLVLLILKHQLRPGVTKEYEHARSKKRRVLIYIYQNDANKTDGLKEFIQREVFRFNPGFYSSTLDLIYRIKEDLQNEVVTIFKSTIGKYPESVLRVEPKSAESIYRYYSKNIIDENITNYSALTEDQIIILAEEIRSKTGNLKEALLISEIGIEIYRNSWKLLNNRGLILDEMGMQENAFQSYLQAYELNNEDETILYNIGNYYYDIKKYELAIEYYLKSLKISPEKKNALNKISVAYRNLKQYDKFLDYARIVYNLEQNEMYETNYILALCEAGYKKESLKLMNNSILLSNQKRNILSAYLKWDDKDYQGIINILGLGDDVSNIEVSHILIESYLAIGDVGNAIKAFHIMKSINSFSPMEYNNFGFLLQKYEEYDLSVEYLKKCIELSPEYVEPWITLTASLGFQKKYEEALQVCNESLAKYPFESRLIRNKYLIYINQGQFKEAFIFLIEKMFQSTGLSDTIPKEIMQNLYSSLKK